MSSLAHTGRLTRLILRLDRVKLPLVVVGFALIMYAMVVSVVEVYSTLQERTAYALTSAASAIARAFNGPVNGITMGDIVVAETFCFSIIFVGLMNTFFVVRHTRKNEESGRSELVGAAVVGRYSQLTATLFVAVIMNVVFGSLVALGLLAAGLPVDGSIAYGSAFAAIGIFFASATAVFAQLAKSARIANGMAALAVAVAFLVRAVGDTQGRTAADGLSATSGWVSLLSPIGWAQAVKPFSLNAYWPIILLLASSSILVLVAYQILHRRDLGAGIFADRPSKASASRLLLSRFGLTLKLQKGMFIGWAIGILVFGVTLGAIADEASSIAEGSEQIAELITTLGGTSQFVDAYLMLCFSLIAVALTGYFIQSLLSMRGDETDGKLEPLLATPLSRKQWMLTNTIFAMVAAALLMLIAGLSTAITYQLVTSDSSKTAEIVKIAIIQIPAMYIFGGLTVFLLGSIARLAVGVSWVVFGVMFLIFQFGALLKLPERLIQLSPYTKTGVLPSKIDYRSLVVMLVIFVVLVTAGVVGFGKRDIDT